MHNVLSLASWDCPIAQVEPNGFEHVRITIRDIARSVEFEATISLKEALELGERLLIVSKALAPEGREARGRKGEGQ